MFSSIGPGTVNIYKSDAPLELPNLTNSVSYKSRETIKSYNGIEPRVSFRYTLSPTSSIKLGYNRIYQYLHLVTNTTAITPIDIWQPSGYYFKPQLADQFSIGFFRTTKKKMYDAFVEFYHKKIDNIIDFKDGAKLILNQQIETDLLQGKGTAYGIETQITKSLGRLMGSVSYTYSRSLRTIQGPTDAESVNKGKEYPSNFDQPHIVNISWKYNISRRYFFTGNFTYRTGRPVTLPISGFVVDGVTIANFSERNQYRIQDYHRLDVEGSHKRKKLFDGTWTFSIFNLYGRKNPFTVFFQGTTNGGLIPYQLSIIGTALPSITYTVKF
jgi:TonB dependent receptor